MLPKVSKKKIYFLEKWQKTLNKLSINVGGVRGYHWNIKYMIYDIYL
jgi:hypothetical protein